MASGDTLAVFTPHANVPPSSNFATFDTRNGHLVLDFDPTTDESALFPGVLPSNYGGNGITVRLFWSATSATSGSVRWDVAIERIASSGIDTDADDFASAQGATSSAQATSGQLQHVDIAFTSGAQMDSLAAGEPFRLKVTRDADASGGGTDDMAGDAEPKRPAWASPSGQATRFRLRSLTCRRR